MSYAAAARECLVHELAPIADLLEDPAMTDLHIVAGGQAFVERGRGREKIAIPYSFADLDYIARLAAAATGQDIAPDVPTVSTQFPGGQRVQISRPPDVPDGTILFSIRNPTVDAMTLEQLVEAGTLTPKHARLISAAVRHQIPIVFSGLVGSGKTTLLRSAIKEAPLHWRLVTIEDMREILGMAHENVAHLLYSKGGQGVASTSAGQLVESAMRMGMDGVLLQEVRDGEGAHAYLGLLKSGHWALTTTHSDSPDDAYVRLAGLVKEHAAGMHLGEAETIATLRRCIPIVIHCRREGDRRFVRDVVCTWQDAPV